MADPYDYRLNIGSNSRQNAFHSIEIILFIHLTWIKMGGIASTSGNRTTPKQSYPSTFPIAPHQAPRFPTWSIVKHLRKIKCGISQLLSVSSGVYQYLTVTAILQNNRNDRSEYVAAFSKWWQITRHSGTPSRRQLSAKNGYPSRTILRLCAPPSPAPR
jgi:hypothetical protein